MKSVLEIPGLDPRLALLVIYSTLLTAVFFSLPYAGVILFQGEVIGAVVTFVVSAPSMMVGGILLLPWTLPAVVVVWAFCRVVLWWSGLTELRASQIAAALAGMMVVPLSLQLHLGQSIPDMIPVPRSSFWELGRDEVPLALWLTYLAPALAGYLAATMVYRVPFSPVWPRGRAG